MNKLMCINQKSIFRSAIYWIYNVAVLLFFLFLILTADIMGMAKFISYAYTLEYMTYLEITLFVIVFCLSSYYTKKPFQLEDVVHVPVVQKILARYFAILSMSLSVCAIPLTYILVSSSLERTQLSYTLSTIFVIMVRWSEMILLSHSISFFVSTIVKSVYTYILCIPFAITFSYLNLLFIDKLPLSDTLKTKISQLFSVNKLFISGMEIDYTGLRINQLLFWKVLFLILCSSVIIYLLIALKRKQIKDIFVTLFFAIGCICSAIGYLSSFPEPYSSIEKMYVPKTVASYYIESYSGQIELNSISRFRNIELSMLDLDNTESVTFRLDECFNIDNIYCNDLELDFLHEGDSLTVFLPSIQKGKCNLIFNYTGRVSYYSDSQNVDIFTEPLSSSLPPRFAFLPTIDDERKVSYNLTVTSNNTVISNLNTEEILLDKDCYLLTGTSTSICIFSGYFDTTVYDGVLVYKAKYNKATSYSEIYDASKRFNARDRYNKPDEHKQLEQKKCKKAFLIYFFYDTNGFPIVYDDYLIMNYGYIM